MDAVSDRDFAVEFCAAGALLAVHLSRLAEDVILLGERGIQFHQDRRRLHHRLVAHAAEEESRHRRTHARQDRPRLWANLTVAAHAAERIADDLQSRFARGQGTAVRHRRHRARLDAAHGRDVVEHEDQSRRLRRPPPRDPALLATDLADYLVRKGMAFRQAHHVVGRGGGVAVAENLGKPLNQLTLAELQTIDQTFGRDALGVFNLQRAMAKRNLTGAPGTKEVAKQLARWREQLS